MKREERINEITTPMKSFLKETYQKSEILSELLLLQKELVEVVFGKDNEKKQIGDVKRKLEYMSRLNDNVDIKKLELFCNKCNEIDNRIKAEISGNKGEKRTFQRLEYMRGFSNLIKNLELTDRNFRTEIDGVVITSKAIFIIEVKNTKKNIVIDKQGNYYRTGTYTRLDSNIGKKVKNKELLIKNALSNLELPVINIKSLIVFTNNNIEVCNHFDEIQTCFLGQLPYSIEEYKGENIYSEEEIMVLTQQLEDSRCKESYKYDLDIKQFKQDFAEIIFILEEEAYNENKEENRVHNQKKEQSSYKEVEDIESIRKKVQKLSMLQREKVLASVSGLAVLVGISVVALTTLTKNK